MATTQEITGFIERCTRWFNRHYPGGETVDLWANELKFIPFQSIDRVFDRIKRLDSWPTNFPRKVKEIYDSVKPVQSQTNDPIVGCPECEDGYLWVRKDGYGYVFRCGRCRTRQENGIPMATRQQVIGRGYTLDWVHDIPRRNTPPIRKDVKALAAGMIEEVPF